MTLEEITLKLTNNPYYYTEMFFVVLVMILQLILSFKLYISINKLRLIFNRRIVIKNGFVEKSKIGSSEDILSEIHYDIENSESLNQITDDNIVKITLVHSTSDNEIVSRIQQTLNSYLVNNYGAAVNFSIIKDIIDREVDVIDEEIAQSIPTPLYLGLVATMFGIIFGLMAMPELNGDGFAEGINALINGVKLAMTASLTGLLLTTILSSHFYKKAKRIVLRAKNDQLSYLQAKLLPELVRAEDTGVSGLKASLDRFAREATKISDNVKIAANQTGLNLRTQLDVISKVENLNMTKVSRVNLELFDQLDSNMMEFKQFSKYLTLMNKISENLLNFSIKTENIDAITKDIKYSLQDSQELTRFLTAHFQQIQSAGSAALNAVNLSDSHFREAIAKLTDETNARIDLLNNVSDTTESTIKETFDSIGSKLNEIAEKHLNSLNVAYNESIPHFEQLDNLEILPSFKEENTTNSKELIEAINQLNSSLNKINSKIDNQAVLAKLDNISNSLKHSKKSETKTIVIDSKAKKENLFKKFINQFKLKRKPKSNEEG